MDGEHRGRSRAFTLLEILIILVVLAILITLAIPNLLSAKSGSNESAALATVRMIVQAQMGFLTRKLADEDQDGTGEFATLGELSGGVPIRAAFGGTDVINPPELATSFRALSALGELTKQGYIYRLYLPDVNGVGLVEVAGGGADPGVDSETAESAWCVYAWPQVYGQTGGKTYFASATGDILFTEDSRYSGPGAPITAGAALQLPGAVDSILGNPATNSTGRDGNAWKIAGR
jgi:type II secretory pathway pseudopilin PulG